MPSGGGSSTTTTKSELAPQQKELLNGVIPIAKDYLAKPLQLFPGSTIAGPSDLQLQGRDMVKNAATGTVQDLTNGATAGIAQGAGIGGISSGASLGQLLSGGAQGSAGIQKLMQGMDATGGARNFFNSGTLLNPNTNAALAPMTEAAIRPMTDNLMHRIMPGIRSQSVGDGMLGSSRQGIAEGNAITDYMRQASDTAAGIQNNAFNTGLGAMLSSANKGVDMGIAGTGLATDAAAKAASAGSDLWMKSLGMTPDIAKLSLMPGMTMEGLGAIQQQQNQAQLTEQANRFTQQQMMPFLQAQDVAQLAFGIGGGSTTSTATQNQGNGLGSALGMLMMLPFM